MVNATLISQLLGPAWCVPMIAYLVLNFRGVSLGASISCIGCYTFHDTFRIQKPSTSIPDRDVLGWLQILSKVLEVWFTFLAGRLVYEIALGWFLVDPRHGLPLGWVTVPAEFSSFGSYGKKTFWQGTGGLQKTRGWYRLRDTRRAAFALLLIFLCLLANLVGPSIAILVIPQLQWKRVEFFSGPTFLHNYFNYPPFHLGLSSCTDNQTLARQYSCLEDTYSTSLDALLSSRTFSDTANLTINLPTISQQGSTQFAFNSSAEGFLWAPSRYVLNWLTTRVDGLQTSGRQWDAQSVEFHGLGPVYGINARCTTGSVTEVELNQNQGLMCYNGLADAQSSHYYADSPALLNVSITGFLKDAALCMPTGSSWDFNTTESVFISDSTSVSANEMPPVSSAITMRTQSTEKGFLIQSPDNTSPECIASALLNQSHSPSCRNLPVYASVSNFSITTYKTIDPSLNSTSSTWCPWTVTTLFAEYVLDASDPAHLVSVQGLPPSYAPKSAEYVHADWLLIAWSIEAGSSISSASRPALQRISAAVSALQDSTQTAPLRAEAQVHLTRLQELIIGHGLSLSDSYSTATMPGTPVALLEQPGALNSWYNIQVYAFGLESRTSLLGATVVIMCLIVILIRAAIFLFYSKLTSQLASLDFILLAFRMQAKEGALDEINTDGAMRKLVKIGKTGNRGEPTFVLAEDDIKEGAVGLISRKRTTKGYIPLGEGTDMGNI